MPQPAPPQPPSASYRHQTMSLGQTADDDEGDDNLRTTTTTVAHPGQSARNACINFIRRSSLGGMISSIGVTGGGDRSSGSFGGGGAGSPQLTSRTPRELRRQYSHESAASEQQRRLLYQQQQQQQQQRNAGQKSLWNFRANFGTSFDSGTGTISGPTPPPPLPLPPQIQPSRGRNLPMPKVPAPSSSSISISSSGVRMIPDLPQPISSTISSSSSSKPSLRRLPSASDLLLSGTSISTSNLPHSLAPAHQSASPVPPVVPNTVQLRQQTSLPSSSTTSTPRKLPIARQKSRELPYLEDVLSGQSGQSAAVEKALQSSSGGGGRPSLHSHSSYAVSVRGGEAVFFYWFFRGLNVIYNIKRLHLKIAIFNLLPSESWLVH